MKVGFISILGRPNVGKSTMMNDVINYPLSIITSTPQTTRDKIKGIYTDESAQIIFLDTPGIHKPKQKIGETMNEVSYSSIKDADLVLFLTPVNETLGKGDKLIISKLINVKNKVAVLTKIDLKGSDVAKEKAQELKTFGFKDVIGYSEKMHRSKISLIDYVKENIPEGHLQYDEDYFTDLPTKFIIKEYIREAAIKNTYDEVPHSIGVVIDTFIEPKSPDEQTKIEAIIYVEKESQKGIVVGMGGKKIKTIGQQARKRAIELIGGRVHLGLSVKVNKNWTDDEQKIKKIFK